MFSGKEKILDEMGTITLAKDALKLFNDVDPGTFSYFLILNNFYDSLSDSSLGKLKRFLLLHIEDICKNLHLHGMTIRRLV